MHVMLMPSIWCGIQFQNRNQRLHQFATEAVGAEDHPEASQGPRLGRDTSKSETWVPTAWRGIREGPEVPGEDDLGSIFR